MKNSLDITLIVALTLVASILFTMQNNTDRKVIEMRAELQETKNHQRRIIDSQLDMATILTSLSREVHDNR